MLTAAVTRQRMEEDTAHWYVPLMEFVDDWRSAPDVARMREPFALGGDAKLDALLAGVIEMLCKEVGYEAPPWGEAVGPAPRPWFVSGLENLKASALVESPVYLRRRRVFVLENFLDRA